MLIVYHNYILFSPFSYNIYFANFNHHGHFTVPSPAVILHHLHDFLVVHDRHKVTGLDRLVAHVDQFKDARVDGPSRKMISDISNVYYFLKILNVIIHEDTRKYTCNSYSESI